MRIVVDLQACQFNSRFRGIGRYSFNLFSHMAQQAAGHDLIAVLSDREPGQLERIRAQLAHVLPPENIKVFSSLNGTEAVQGTAESGARTREAEILREAFMASMRPDVIHVASLFDGFGDSTVSTSSGHEALAHKTAVTLYDLIPLNRPEQYLSEPVVSAWYHERLKQLRGAAQLLAISEHARQEAIELLPYPADRISNISSGVDPFFHKLVVEPLARSAVLTKFGIRGKFVLYSGGYDSRKNLPALIDAWSRARSRSDFQLVIAGFAPAADIDALLAETSSRGLPPHAVLCLGYVSDEDLRLLYNLTELYVFPSLYEGFGLPVLEAMACGAPAISSSYTSLPEVTGLPEAMFDPTDPAAMAAKIDQVLESAVFANALRVHAQSQASRFTWKASAAKAIEALEQLHDRNRQAAAVIVPTRPALALVASDASVFDEHGIRALLKQAEISYTVTKMVAGANERALSETDRRIYIADARAGESQLFPLLQRYPGQVLLRGFTLSGSSESSDQDVIERYVAHGYPALVPGRTTSTAPYAREPGNASWIEASNGMLCLDCRTAALADTWYGAGTSCYWGVLNDSADEAKTFAEHVEESLRAGRRGLLERALVQVSGLDATLMPPPEVDRFARAAAANVEPVLGRRQLLVDVTELAQTDAGTGIQRVVRNITRELLQRRMSELRVEPVVLDASGNYRYARAFSCRLLGVPSLPLEDDFVEYAQGDVFLGLDLVPSTTIAMGAYHHMRSLGVILHFVVYDLLPIRNSEGFPQASVEAFTRWFDEIGRVAHGLVAISRAVADEVMSELRALRLIDKNHLPQRIGYFHLGSDIDGAAGWSPGELEKSLFDEIGNGTVFLMVSTIEPRKSHAQVLEAFERWWREQEDTDARLVIVGKKGWLVDELVSRLESHPELGKRLFWLRRVSDGMLDALYRRASAVIVASVGEGFGLPLIEASTHGTPIIARDLPVFREVAGEHAFYFSGHRPGQLLGALREWVGLRDMGTLPVSSAMQRLSWRESADQLLNCIRDGMWYRDFEPNGTWSYPMHHRALGTLVGFRQGGTIGSLGKAGFLLFGPYGHLPGGHYRFQLRGEAGELSGAELEISADRGRRLIARPPWQTDLKHGLLIDVPLELDADANEFEVRVRVAEETELVISEYTFAAQSREVSPNPASHILSDAELADSRRALLVADDSSSPGGERLDAALGNLDAVVYGGLRRRGVQGICFGRDDFHRQHTHFAECHFEISNTASAVPVLDALVRYGGHAWLVDDRLDTLVKHCPADLRVKLVWNLGGHRAVRDFYAEPERFDSSTLTRCIHAVASSVTTPNMGVDPMKNLASHVHNQVNSLSARRLLVDVSALAKHDARTGVQRVVRNVLRYLDDTVSHDLLVTPVHFIEGGGFRYAQRFAAKIYEYPGDALVEEDVQLRASDIFFGLDLSAHLIPFHREHFAQMRAIGIPVTFVVQDMLPLRRPDFFSEPVVHVFRLWYGAIVELADRLICISRATADELLDCCDQFRPDRETPLAIDYFHLGADLEDDVAAGAHISTEEQQVLDRIGDSCFLAVSTIEPRKGHRQLLAAFELLWAAGADVQLVLVGRQGWMVDDLIEQIRHHPLRNERLFWFDSVSDAVLNALYGRAAALMSPSLGEGFGLPLIEAAHAGLPVICRDLNVFREVAGEHAHYFHGDEPEVLSEAVRRWLLLREEGRVPRSTSMTWNSWSQSTEELWQALQGRRPYRQWIAGDRRYFPAYDARLGSTSGRLEAGRIVSVGTAGYLVYGPYVSIPAGRYRASIHLHLVAGSPPYFEVAANKGGALLHEQILTGESGSEDGATYEVEFELMHSVDDLELRLLIEADVDCRFSAYELFSMSEVDGSALMAASSSSAAPIQSITGIQGIQS